MANLKEELRQKGIEELEELMEIWNSYCVDT